MGYTIDYPFALLSRGCLATALNGAFDVATPGQVEFNWDDISTDQKANATTNQSYLFSILIRVKAFLQMLERIEAPVRVQ